MSNLKCTLYTTIKKNSKFEKTESKKNLKDFKDFVLKKYNLVAADIYHIDENKFYKLIENSEAFLEILADKKEVHFFIDENIEGSDKSSFTKFDTRNLKSNDEFKENRNDKKSWNFLQKIKKKKILINKQLRAIKIHPQKFPEEAVEDLQAALQEYKEFDKKRLIKKYWKSRISKIWKEMNTVI